MRWASVPLLATIACGRIGFDANGVDPGDGGPGDDSGAALCVDLVAHFKLDETLGTSTLDSISQANASLSGGVSFSPAGGVLGGAAAFPANGYIEVTRTDDLPVADFTWAVWIKPDDLSNRVLFSMSSSDNTAETNLKWASRFDLEFRLNSVVVFNDVSGFTADSTWQHVAIIRAGDTMTVYRNGAVLETITDATVINFAPGMCALGIGAGVACQPATVSQPWSGLIDDLRVYRRGLATAEVEALYQASLAGDLPSC